MGPRHSCGDVTADARVSSGHTAGVRGFAVPPIELSPHPDGLDDREYRADLLNYPQAILIDCVKD